MKAIILAAGRGTRLGKYTDSIPKGLLKLSGKTLLELQIECYRNAGITDISIVKGYRGELINYSGVKYYWNRDFASTNMVVSLMKASQEFTDDIIVSYADIVFELPTLRQIIKAKNDITILVDNAWEKYWYMRYGTLDCDLESLKIDNEGNISEIGKTIINKDEMNARYIGILKFSKERLNDILNIAVEASNSHSTIPWKYSGKPYSEAYMTDLLQALVDKGIKVKAESVSNGWLEFDSARDYEKALFWISNSTINALFKDFNALINNNYNRRTKQ